MRTRRRVLTLYKARQTDSGVRIRSDKDGDLIEVQEGIHARRVLYMDIRGQGADL